MPENYASSIISEDSLKAYCICSINLITASSELSIIVLLKSKRLRNFISKKAIKSRRIVDERKTRDDGEKKRAILLIV